ncbi:hypothetical protein [Pseudomonas sp. IT-P294]|uniref:hypothetical protein n=1 Tax=Pseudomonas sp. IT-P294 TaxID=3026454 RepID=UPI0039E04F36
MILGWRKIWNDPVWSKVISALILLFFGLLATALPPNLAEYFIYLAQYKIVLSAWIIILTLGTLAATTILIIRTSSRSKLADLTSKQWFSEIDQQIKDCNFARIYLRDFAHPDQFKSDHRESLLSFMRSLAERLEAGADIRVIAYHTSLSDKSGLDWLSSEITTNKAALDKIKLIKNQPISNASSMYLFDSGAVLYNRRLKSGHSYHIENLQGSIVHFLIESGFNSSEGELS